MPNKSKVLYLANAPVIEYRRSPEDAHLIMTQADEIVQLEQVIAEQAIELWRLRHGMPCGVCG